MQSLSEQYLSTLGQVCIKRCLVYLGHFVVYYNIADIIKGCIELEKVYILKLITPFIKINVVNKCILKKYAIKILKFAIEVTIKKKRYHRIF